jgi:hypothetical protein
MSLAKGQSWFIADLFFCFPNIGSRSTGDKQTSKGLFNMSPNIVTTLEVFTSELFSALMAH